MALGRKTGGRVKGTPNKVTTAVKEALELAFDGIGGVAQLRDWAQDNPTEFYKLWAKMLPQEVNSKVESFNRTALIADRPVTEDEWAAESARLN